MSVSTGPLETVMLLGTASLELTGSFQVPGRQILSSLIAWTLEHSFQRDFSLQRERELILEQMEEGQGAG